MKKRQIVNNLNCVHIIFLFNATVTTSMTNTTNMYMLGVILETIKIM